MPLKDLFVFGVHVGGATGRKRSPRFIHALVDNTNDTTRCGYGVSHWSRKLLKRRQVQDLPLDAVCRLCAHAVGLI